MRFWYFIRKTVATFTVGFLAGSVAAILVIAAAAVCVQIFT